MMREDKRLTTQPEDTMRPTPTTTLHFLRPYAFRPPLDAAAQRQIYLRFYHAARHQELVRADALRYPRIRRDGVAAGAAAVMRIPAFRDKYKSIQKGHVAEEDVVLRGRVQFVRRASSKLVFLALEGEFTPVQGMLNFGKLEGGETDLEKFKALSKLISRGDIVSLTGRATRTQTGELTLVATRMPEILAPALVPLPVHLADEEARMHQRHVDMLVNRPTADTLRLRSSVIKYMRDFFGDKDFIEVQTPILAQAAGGAAATPFTTTVSSSSQELALRIAPELWLKRLVVGGMDRVFELGPSFRNEGIDSTHNPEFTTCEFYSAYASLDDLIRMTEDLVCGLAEHCRALIETKLLSLPAVDTTLFRRPFKQMEFIPSLEAALGFTMPDLSGDTALADLTSLLAANGIDVPVDGPTSLSKLLDRLASVYIEPHSSDGVPLFITHHPVCMSPLSKSFVCPKTGQHVSARAELFVSGRELANMYEEENDPFAQRDKFIAQAAEAKNGEGIKIDESYVAALEAGLPPTGGWGCGVERLVMLFSGARRISECLSFGGVRHVVAVSGLREPALSEEEEDS
ncbi:hypothetical protein QBC47DRAFT_388770 [Echria macrotheca]|uniref:Lysyl-tRNA synthetase n=1 Tax=Echria macrotheca TaxID=438768 RepID=A0AAJ0F8V3_9PEZI|nr:hypothetical protein QBC47DRAFT_388770 [Echria macrotheca]